MSIWPKDPQKLQLCLNRNQKALAYVSELTLNYISRGSIRSKMPQRIGWTIKTTGWVLNDFRWNLVILIEIIVRALTDWKMIWFAQSAFQLPAYLKKPVTFHEMPQCSPCCLRCQSSQFRQNDGRAVLIVQNVVQNVLQNWNLGELTETCIQHFQSLRPKLGTTDSGQKLGDDQVVLGLSCVQNGCHKACANYIG